MTYAKRVGLAVLLGAAVASPSPAADNGLQIGLVQGLFRDVQPAMVQVMSRPLRDLIQRQTGLTGDVELVADGDALADRLKGKRYQLGVFHGFEFAWAKARHPDLMPLVVSIPPGRKLQACVVVNKASEAAKLADLGDEAVLVPRGVKGHCLLYLDQQRAGLPAACAKPKTKPLVTAEEALDAVVSGDAAAALMDLSAVGAYQTLQPGASKNLRVLCQSDPFPQTVIAYYKGAVDGETTEKVRRLLTEAHTSAAGKPLLMLWNLKGFEDVPADYDAQLDKVRKAFPAPAVVADK